jgi:SAM-dependent methyltransferase
VALYTRLGDLLLGYAGLALLRSRITDLGGKEFSDARVADIRRIVEHWDDEPTFQWEAFWEETASAEGFALWAQTYDSEPNPLVDLDDATLGPLLERYPPGRALDAACGTGRWARFLSQRGHTVRGIDESPEMLQIARATTPEVEFYQADLRSLPVADASVDLVVCSLALTYLPQLDPVFAEFARVLRRGGHAVVSNVHHLALMLGGVTQFRTSSGRPIRLPASGFMPTEYISAALRSGFGIRSCAEIPWPDLAGGHGGSVAQAWCPEAARAAYVGTPALVVVEVQRG